jgi:CTP synthase
MARFIFVTGGVISSLGKGLAAASLGALLKSRGFRVRLRKLDPYLNVDPGTLSPYQHGEVYVTDDGTETDLDLGHYERFSNVDTTARDYTTTGKIYLNVLNKERQGEYLGATVQVIPHITQEIKEFLTTETQEEDFVICEIGGTVGDIESLPFLEAIRQFRQENGAAQTLFIHVALVPYIETASESKTKPVQHSVKEMQRAGIQPDIVFCRCDRPLSLDNRHKLALFCNVPLDNVIEAKNVPSIYQAPVIYHQAGLDTQVLKHFNLDAPLPDITPWEKLTAHILDPQKEVRVAIVGKYINFPDTYKSLLQALIHAGAHHETRCQITWVDAELLEDNGAEFVQEQLGGVDGIIIPGGFGIRGVEGKIRALSFARTHKIPCLGICLGMQLMVIETARHLAGLQDAHSSEFGISEHLVVGLLSQWEKQGAAVAYQGESKGMGGTMRLGSYPTYLVHHTKAWEIYGQEKIAERHRHRYEVNMTYKDTLEKAGLVFSGLSPDGQLPEMVERADHPWFVGCQFHPELKSRPFRPHPLFISFLSACLDRRKEN